jgi:NAD(P)-dependent dehydrogenase (short-subunit alcohol dehydrogenase family)
LDVDENEQAAGSADLTGRIAVVTGAGSGLGAAMCRRFAAAGMRIAALDIDADNAAVVAGALADEHGVPTMSARVDVGDAGSLAAAAAEVERALGGCDVLCANVGVQQFGAIDRLTDDDWRWIVDVNVMGTVRTVASFLPLIRGRSGWRRIVLTASSGVLVPGVRLGAYTTTKFAVQGYGETLRMELADEGIGVTVMFPAGMMTRHLESSALARPADRGEWVILPDDIEVMMSSRKMGDEHVATPDHAVRNLLADLLANEPYVITHGAYRDEYHERLADLERAFDRMERS